MSLLIIGSVAIDSIETPWGRAKQVLGGSATYSALSARLWTPPSMVAVVGTDFPAAYRRMFLQKGLNGGGFTQAQGRTFRWRGRYSKDLQPTTLHLDLGVFARFNPKLTPRLSKVRHAFLGNIQPELQLRVLKQLKNPRLTACDSRDDWIKSDRKGFLKLLKKMDILFLNDSEARLLTGLHGLVQATRALARLGPKVAVVKKGEHGVLAASRDCFFSLPGYPVERITDPTGAGDAFAGASMGYLATQRRLTWMRLCQSIQYGSIAALMAIEAFGPAALVKATRREVVRRSKVFQSLARVAVL
jgi:sugar/nucleoside kinase (ribokinase family)